VRGALPDWRASRDDLLSGTSRRGGRSSGARRSCRAAKLLQHIEVLLPTLGLRLLHANLDIEVLDDVFFLFLLIRVAALIPATVGSF
jgi:hypothetical protein